MRKQKSFKQFLREYSPYTIQDKGEWIDIVFHSPEDMYKFDLDKIQGDSKWGEIIYVDNTIRIKKRNQ